jgi:ADP-heptose:LPS heptosyltransferase
VLAAPASIAPLAALSATVDEVVDTAPLAPLDPALHGADVAVNLHGRGPRSHRLLQDARPRRLVAFDDHGPGWRSDEHEVHRWCRLLRHAGIAADPADLHLPAPAVPPPPAWRGATVVHPGAASGARRWPPGRWAEVARRLAGGGRTVLVTGGPGEVALAEEVAGRAGLPPSAVLAGRTDLIGLAAVVAAADLLLCGDTGVAHLATALGIPSVVLFGPVPPSEWGPPPDRPQHVALWAGHRGDPHAADVDPGLLRITVDDVLAAPPLRPRVIQCRPGDDF